MSAFFLSLHVIAAIVAIGPVTVAASMFPAAVRRARAAGPGATAPIAVVRLLHRVCRVYAGVGVAVPVLGFATAGSMGVLTDPWLIVSVVLTGVAAALLIVLLLPGQEELVAEFDRAEGAGDGGAIAPTVGPAGAGGTVTAPDPAAPTAGTTAATGHRDTVRLAMVTGVFNLLWATVTVLMIVRPGSSTGV